MNGKIIINDIEFVPGGFNTLVNCDAKAGKVIKVVTGNRGEGACSYELDEGLAKDLSGLLRYYVDGLSSLVDVPDTRISIVKNGVNMLVWIDQDFAGKDLGVLLPFMNLDQVRDASRQIKQNFINKLTHHSNVREDGNFILGADLKAPNFCLDKNGKLVLVDIFPPHVWKNGTAVVEIFHIPPEVYKVGLWKVFQEEGMLVNTLAQLGRVRVDCWNIYKEELTCPINLASVDIDTLEAKDIYIMRLLSCEYTYANKLPQEMVSKFFACTHFESFMTDQKLEEVKRKLRNLKKGEAI